MKSSITENISIKKIERYNIKKGTRLICDEAFIECMYLKEITFPSSVNFIGRRAFYGCIRLSTLHLPNSLFYIGYRAFDCEQYDACIVKREAPLTVYIPSSVEIIDGNPFCYNTIINCYNSRFKVKDNILYSADEKVLISYCCSKEEFYIPNGVEKIGIGAFQATPIKIVHFPESLKVIDRMAFKNAKNLEQIIFPNSLKEIREKAFDGCCFNEISLSKDIEKIAPDAFCFEWCVKIVKVPKGTHEYYSKILPQSAHNYIHE